MNFSNLKPAHVLEVEQWLKEELDLTPYQRARLRDNEIVRFSQFLLLQENGKRRRLVMVAANHYPVLAILHSPYPWDAFQMAINRQSVLWATVHG